jgi:hypothetical protein
MLHNAEEARRHAERWCAFHYGELDAEAERALEDEYLDDPDLCAELYRELNLEACLQALAPPKPATEAPPRRRRRRWPALAIGLSLTVSIGSLGWFLGRSGPPTPPSVASECQPIAPLGALTSAPGSFRWSREDGATRYRFVLRDQAGKSLHEATVADTVYSLPAPVRQRLDGPGSGSWYLEPLDPSGRRMDRSREARIRWGG